jgi:hypothetical protein
MMRFERIEEIENFAVGFQYIGNAQTGKQQNDITNLNQL